MGAAFILMLREGIEAALIVSIVLAYLRQLGRSDRATLVWWGTAAAVALSVVVGAIIFAAAGEFEGRAEQVFEGIVSLLAVGFLTWMIFWMRRQASRIKGEIHERVDSALGGGGIGLATLAFAMVLREGIETALFLFGTFKATATGAGGAWGQITGAAIGLVTAVVLGYLLYRRSIKLNLRTFFRVTGGLLLLVAAGLLAFSAHELQEAGYLGFLTGQAYDISGTLNDESGLGAVLRGLIGYQDKPSALEVVAWIGYLAVAGVFFFRPLRVRSSPVPAGVISAGGATPPARHH